MNPTGEPRRPEAGEMHAFFAAYVDLVPEGDVLEHLAEQEKEFVTVLGSLPEDRGGHRYAPGKWSIRELVGHLVDAERLFACRALHIAREPGVRLPGMDENAWAAISPADRRSLDDLVGELTLCRAASLALFRGFGEEEWSRTGFASDRPFTVRAFPWILEGHARHHLGVLRDRYL